MGRGEGVLKTVSSRQDVSLFSGGKKTKNNNTAASFMFDNFSQVIRTDTVLKNIQTHHNFMIQEHYNHV